MPQTFKGTQLHGLTRPGNRATYFALEAGEIFITFVLLMLAFIVALSLPSPANAAENSPPVFHYWLPWQEKLLHTESPSLLQPQEEIPGVLGHHETTVSQNKHFQQTFSVPNVFFEIAADSFLL